MQTVVNFVTQEVISRNKSIFFPYPEGKEPGRYYGAINHMLSFEGQFFSSPRDFMVLFHPDKFEMVWQRDNTIPAQTLMHLQIDEPGGQYFSELKFGIMIKNMVRSQVFMMNLGQPQHANHALFFGPGPVAAAGPLGLTGTQDPVSRNVSVSCEGNAKDVIFKVYGEDVYQRPMCEYIDGCNAGVTVGKKAFTRVNKVVASGPADGNVSVGTGDKLGLPAFLPGSGFVLRYMIDGRGLTGGVIIPGYSGRPGPYTGDVRGTFTLPQDISLDGRKTVQILVSLFNAANIGLNDYAE